MLGRNRMVDVRIPTVDSCRLTVPQQTQPQRMILHNLGWPCAATAPAGQRRPAWPALNSVEAAGAVVNSLPPRRTAK